MSLGVSGAGGRELRSEPTRTASEIADGIKKGLEARDHTAVLGLVVQAINERKLFQVLRTFNIPLARLKNTDLTHEHSVTNMLIEWDKENKKVSQVQAKSSVRSQKRASFDLPKMVRIQSSIRASILADKLKVARAKFDALPTKEQELPALQMLREAVDRGDTESVKLALEYIRSNLQGKRFITLMSKMLSFSLMFSPEIAPLLAAKFINKSNINTFVQEAEKDKASIRLEFLKGLEIK
jgi:hypothetical protein